jgi:hypothetical protein
VLLPFQWDNKQRDWGLFGGENHVPIAVGDSENVFENVRVKEGDQFGKLLSQVQFGLDFANFKHHFALSLIDWEAGDLINNSDEKQQ